MKIFSLKKIWKVLRSTNKEKESLYHYKNNHFKIFWNIFLSRAFFNALFKRINILKNLKNLMAVY